jgi:lipoate-protein ligase A
MVMLCLISRHNDPYINLAAEEYFLKNTDEELFMLYINNPSIVAGKHQNLLGEINSSWARKQKIILARRLTGGGTVYQDHGNLNFSFISDCPNLENISYKRFTLPIVLALKHLGIEAEYSGHNDLLLESRKISGNAMHIYKNRVLSHGTLLFNAELNNLSSALKNNPDRYIDKSIKSIPSKVVNISEFLNSPLTMTEFVENVFDETCKHLNSPLNYTLSISDLNEIECLSREKYATWSWIFGYSPKYVFTNEIALCGQSVKFRISVEKGLIKSYSLEEDNNPNKQVGLIFDSLINIKHDYQAILELFLKESLSNLISGISVENFCDQFF